MNGRPPLDVSIILDTVSLVAIADRSDRWHRAVVDYLEAVDDVLILPVTVLPEADYLVTRQVGAAAGLAMLRSIAAGELQLEPFTRADLERTLQVLVQYADSRIGLVDASIVAIAERLRIERVLTVDQAHFRMFRPRHCAAFAVVPPPP